MGQAEGGWWKAERTGKLRKELGGGGAPAMEMLADHYGIPSINFAVKVVALREAGKLVFNSDDPKAVDVKLTIVSGDRFVPLDGIVVREARPGWVSLELSPLEQWERPLCWLTPEQRERVESADFYRLLQDHVSRRFLAMKRS